MIFGKMLFRDPITTASGALNGSGVTVSGHPVTVSKPSALVPVPQTAVNGIQVVHAVPVLLPVSTNQQLFTLPTVNTAVLCLRANPKRRGLTIINTDPLAILYIGFGGNYPINKCVPLAPGGSDVMDTAATPQDDVWITSDTANASVVMLEFQN